MKGLFFFVTWKICNKKVHLLTIQRYFVRGESFSILNANACYTAQNKELVNCSLKVGILQTVITFSFEMCSKFVLLNCSVIC